MRLPWRTVRPIRVYNRGHLPTPGADLMGVAVAPSSLTRRTMSSDRMPSWLRSASHCRRYEAVADASRLVKM